MEDVVEDSEETDSNDRTIIRTAKCTAQFITFPHPFVPCDRSAGVGEVRVTVRGSRSVFCSRTIPEKVSFESLKRDSRAEATADFKTQPGIISISTENILRNRNQKI